MCATQSSVHIATIFFSSSLLLFLSLPPLRYKVTYSSNHNFLCYQWCFFLLNFRIISKTILHNHSNSIRKLNYAQRKWANTFLFFFFSSCPSYFFSWGWVVCFSFSFFFFSFHAFFFLLELRCFSTSSLFGVGLFSFFFLVGAEFLLLVFGLFSLFLIFWGPCVFSLSFDHLNKPLRNRFPIVFSRFSDRLRGTMVTQSYYTHDTDMPSSGAKYV